MHQFSFDFGDPFYNLAGWQLGLQVITFENTYGLDPTSAKLQRQNDSLLLEAGGLMWAGGQEKCAGRATLMARRTADGLELRASARHPGKIRCTKLIVRGLGGVALIGRRWEGGPLPPGGAVLSYPADLHTPLIFLGAAEGGYYYFRSLDGRVRCKRFAVYQRDGAATVELIHEDAAHEMTKATETPAWRVGRCGDPGAVVADHLAHLERAFGLQPWEMRPDVPAWARDIALVTSIHGMHWTGHIFNTYDQMLQTLEWIAQRIEGRRVLAFLPGWEGRYYWQYGDYRPEPRLGGAQGFRALVDGARRLGVRLMPMFGANCANTGLKDFRRWGKSSLLRSAAGHVYQGNKPDWDTSRAHDPGWQAWLNPGAPGWHQQLLSQVSSVVQEYGLPAVFFDTQHVWENDPNHPLYEGLLALRDTLKARFPDLLVAGEGWYDALGAVTPVSQVGAPARWHEIFSRYNRTFGHLMWGDPSRASSGVHEAGTTGFGLVPNERHWWPTVTIVDGTVDKAADEVERVIAQAREYARRFLS